jgi:hypothetical protein
LGECEKNYKKKDGKLIGLVLMNMRTPFDMFVSNFHTSWQAHREDNNDYTFEYLFCILIIDQHTFLREGDIGGKHQAHFLKGKGNMDFKNRVQSNASAQKYSYHDQGP